MCTICWAIAPTPFVASSTASSHLVPQVVSSTIKPVCTIFCNSVPLVPNVTASLPTSAPSAHSVMTVARMSRPSAPVSSASAMNLKFQDIPRLGLVILKFCLAQK